MNDLVKQKSDDKKAVERTKSKRTIVPSVDIIDGEKETHIVADMPGVNKSSVDITLKKNILTISGKVPSVDFEGYNYSYEEYKSGDYYRSFSINHEIDKNKIEAVVSDGVLKLTLPKIDSVAKRIEVKAA